jgi:putative transposase
MALHHAGQSDSAGSPTQNGFVESFNGQLRDECLNEHLFANPKEGAADHRGLENRRQHQSTTLEPEGLTPMEFAPRPDQAHNRNRLHL